MVKSISKLWMVLGILFLGTVSGFGQDAERVAGVADSGDTAWMLTSSLLVLMMCLPGLALFYGGLVRGKNVLSLFVQCFAMAGVMSIIWVVFGYAIATGDSNGGVFGWSSDKLFLNHLFDTSEGSPGIALLSGSIPESVFVMFQMTFIIIAPAIVVGAFAERMKFKAVMIFTVIWTVFSYLPMWHMAWSSDGIFHNVGWLMGKGQAAIDFAGGNVVHINAGIAGLVACMVVGKRKGFPGPSLVPHNVPFVAIGAALLWVGWFGFNAGSAAAADSGAGMAMLVTQIAAAAGIIAWTVVEYIVVKKVTAVGIATGAVAGLVAITPAAGSTDVMGALAIGGVSGAICFLAVTKIKHQFNYDDSLDVFGVHGIGGIVGALLSGVFIREGAGDPGLLQFWVQAKSVIVTIIWSGGVSLVAIYITKAICGELRVSEDVEHTGLDLTEHGEEAYNTDS